jgi:nitrous oxidase accessory protein NosD
MSVINDSTASLNVSRIGEVATGSTGALHVTPKPIPTSVGHYRVCVKVNLIAAQAANSRLFELRNAHATNLIIPTRLELRWLQTAAHTAAILDAIDLFKVTGFTAVDTTNTVTPVPSLLRTSFAATAAAIRHVTIAGAAAGMTGGTLTKDSNAVGMLEQWLLGGRADGGERAADRRGSSGRS